MKTRFRAFRLLGVLLAALLVSNVIPDRPAHAYDSGYTDVSLFYDALSPYGNWVDHPNYGRVWYPTGVSAGWRPYTDGHWEWTLDYGWLWVSDWEWGWAPFHYGRWAWDDWYGWLWVPGRVWAPAWVFWRYGGGYSAWAPMPPTVIWQPSYGLVTQHFDYSRDLYGDCWVAVRDHDFHRHDLHRTIINSGHMVRIFNNTKHVKNLTLVNDRIVNQGVPIRQIEQATGRKIRPVRVREQENFRTRAQHRDRDAIDVVRPRLRPPTREDLHQEEQQAVRLATDYDTRSRERPAEGKAHSRSEFYQPRVPERFRDRRANLESGPGNRGENDSRRGDPNVVRSREGGAENMGQEFNNRRERENTPIVLEVPTRGEGARSERQRGIQSTPERLAPDVEDSRGRLDERSPAIQQRFEQGRGDVTPSREDGQNLQQDQPRQRQQGQERDEAVRQQQIEQQGGRERQRFQEQRQMQQQREILRQHEERNRRQQQEMEAQQRDAELQQQQRTQQQMQMQREQAEQEERNRQESMQRQQIDRQRDMERRQQEEMNRQQQREMLQREQAERAERIRQEAAQQQQMQQQREMERQQYIEMQRQGEMQQHRRAEQAERARQEAMQQQQQRDMERQQQMHMQRQMEVQQRQQAEQMQRQQMQRQLEIQQRQQVEQTQRTQQENVQRQQRQERNRQEGQGRRND